MLLYGNYLVFDLMQLSILKHNFVHEYIFVYAFLDVFEFIILSLVQKPV